MEEPGLESRRRDIERRDIARRSYDGGHLAQQRASLRRPIEPALQLTELAGRQLAVEIAGYEMLEM
jgi:hypothetical protein